MISVINAKNKIKNIVKSSSAKTVLIENAHKRVLFDDFKATFNSPAFNQVAMDGYAFNFSEIDTKIELKIVGESTAGGPYNGVLNKNEVVFVFTGAQLPNGTDTVMPIENVVSTENTVKIIKPVKQGSNVRLIGSQFLKNEVLLKSGTRLNNTHISLLAMNGVREINVFESPKIAVLVTGSELVNSGEVLKEGMIYESNSIMLKCALLENNFSDVTIFKLSDNYNDIKNKIDELLKLYQFILLSGGMSVGKYDYVRNALNDNAVNEVFYKVKQKPGKPFYFGIKNNCCVFGLPGNPGAALTCFYEYVLIGLKKHVGIDYTALSMEAPSISFYKKEQGLTHFLKGFYNGKVLEILEGQESYKITSFTKANCLIEMGEDLKEIKSGDLVQFKLFPNHD